MQEPAADREIQDQNEAEVKPAAQTSPAEEPAGQSVEGTPDTSGDETGNEDGRQEATQQNQPAFSPIYTDVSQCEDTGEIVFTVSPIELDAITALEPLGELTGIVAGHITPGDHTGFQYAGPPDFPAYDLRALADGFIVRVERHPYTPPEGYPAGIKNYHVYFEHSCTFFTGYIHVTELAPEILAADDELARIDAAPSTEDSFTYPRIPVKAGQIIGKVQGVSLLGMLTVDTSVTHNDYVTPSIYEGEPWKRHAVAPYDYFTEDIREKLMEKNPRTAEPRGGRYAFDIDGRLVGNWFQDGTGYAGGDADVVQGTCGNSPCPYWNGHLAFVYDFVTPDQVRISIGYDTGLYPGTPYGVKGNTPDPANVSVETGPVKYELVALEDVTTDYGFVTMSMPLITRNDESRVIAVFLVEMVDDRTIKMEIFPDMTAGQVTGFTDSAKIYRR
ncbi:MAG: hypothetical protein V3R36_04610 [Dehalococcoidales bacterium]